jgi:tyrosyl-tRNA synthetase
MPILPGTDGKERMSKSAGNYVGVTDSPPEMFGKVMSIPDEVMGTYYELVVGEKAPDSSPVEAKRGLARGIVERFHDGGAAQEAESNFDRVHVSHGVPEDVEELDLDEIEGIQVKNGLDTEIHLPVLLSGAFGISTSEARRLLQQGGVKLDGEPVPAEPLDVPLRDLAGKVLQAGKRRFKAIPAPPG